MRNRKQGFTLIELLIVIAIIGILAAVLIPNLLNARRQAQVRAAQAYASQTYTVGNAVLAEGIQLRVDEVATALDPLCSAGVTYNPVTAPAGGDDYPYGVSAAPGVVENCIVGLIGGNLAVEIEILDVDGTTSLYSINGATFTDTAATFD